VQVLRLRTPESRKRTAVVIHCGGWLLNQYPSRFRSWRLTCSDAEVAHSRSTGATLHTLLQDLRYSLRQLIYAPGGWAAGQRTTY
jgi:hypothetical protein